LKGTDWGRVMTGDGCPTLTHPEHSQPCHDLGGAWAESHELHVAGCDLGRRLLRGEHLRLLEVGVAPGWNLAAACSLARSLPGRLDVTAVERSRDALLAADELGRDPSWHEGAPEGAVEALGFAHSGLRRAMRPGALGSWVELSGGVRLRLILQDAEKALDVMAPEECFDCVFLDAFSPSVEPESWAARFLRDLALRVDDGGRLTTYTVSQGVRAAIIAGGLNLGSAGARCGRKGGTWASRGGWVPALEERLLAKLGRRSSRLGASEGWVTGPSDLE